MDISPVGFNPIGRVVLGHFAEGNGEHYVVVSRSEGYEEVSEEEDSGNNSDNNRKEEEEKIDFDIKKRFDVEECTPRRLSGMYILVPFASWFF